MNGYHFTGDTLRDGRPIPLIGEWLEHDGPIEPCQSGLHASEHPFDALSVARGNMLHKVELEGDLQSHGDPINKWVGRRRKILATIDAEPLLREFARWCALQVMGDESLRDAAGAAAATWDAARDAAWAAQREKFRELTEARFRDSETMNGGTATNDGQSQRTGIDTSG